MKKQILLLNKHLLVFGYIIFLSVNGLPQNMQWLSTADSVFIERYKNDTTMLRPLTRFPGTRKAAKAGNLIGLHAFKNGNNDKALQEFLISNKLPNMFPEKNESEYFLGRIKQRKGDRSEAKNHFRKYLQKENMGPWADGAHYYYILALNDDKDSDVVSECNRYLAQRPGGYYAKDVRFHKINQYRRNKEYGNCIQEAEQLIQQFPDCSYAKDLKFQIGDWYVKLGQNEQAKQYFRSLMDGNGIWADGAHYHLIVALKKENDSAMTQECRNYLQQRPSGAYSADVRYQLINYYRKNQDYLRCIQESELLIAQSPESNYAKDLRYQIGDFYNKMGRIEEARLHFRGIISSNPVNTEPAAASQFLLAKTYLNEGDFVSARNEYRKVKRLHPGITTWASAGEFAYALSYFEEAEKLNDTLLFQEALQAFESFISAFPSDKRVPIALNNKAEIYVKFENWSKAVESFRAIINFNISTASNVISGYLPQTVKEHERRIQRSRFAMSRILLDKLQRPEESLVEYNTILDTTPDNQEAIYGKALSLIGLKNFDQAKVLLQKLIAAGSGLSAAAKEQLQKIEN